MRKYIRSSVRRPLQLPIQLRWQSRTGRSRRAQGTTGNISGSGVFLALAAPIRTGTSLAFKICFSTQDASRGFELVGKGRVVRSSRHGESPRIAFVIDDYALRRDRAAKHRAQQE